MAENRNDMQDQKIKEIGQELDSFKKQVSEKLEEIMISLSKPILTDRQIASLIISIIVYLVFTINYISGNNFRSIENTKSIEKTEIQNEKMMDLLLQIKEVVDKNEGSKQK